MLGIVEDPDLRKDLMARALADLHEGVPGMARLIRSSLNWTLFENQYFVEPQIIWDIFD
jgi:hypothetical protein